MQANGTDEHRKLTRSYQSGITSASQCLTPVSHADSYAAQCVRGKSSPRVEAASTQRSMCIRGSTVLAASPEHTQRLGIGAERPRAQSPGDLADRERSKLVTPGVCDIEKALLLVVDSDQRLLQERRIASSFCPPARSFR